MAKRTADDDVTGYMHDISPIKISRNNNKYFEGSIQVARNKFNRLVCFDLDKRSKMEAAETAKRALKFNKVRLVPSTFRNDETDVLVYSNSVLSAVEKTPEFSFKQQEAEKEFRLENLSEIQNFNKVSVKAKMIHRKSEVEATTVRGELVKKQDFIIADNTSHAQITLWEDSIKDIEEGKSYHFTDLSVRTYSNKKILSTTKETTITLIDDIDVAEIKDMIDQAGPSKETFTGEVTHITVTSSTSCNNCKKKLVPSKEKFVRCQNCSMKQKSKALTRQLQAVMKLRSSNAKEIKLTAFPSLLSMYLIEQQLDPNIDTEDLEEIFLDKDNITVHYTGDNVVKKIIG